MTEDEMVGWHHRLNEHEFEQAPGDGEGQESLSCCSLWVTESDTTGQLNNNMNYLTLATLQGFQGGTAVKNASANARDTRDMGLIPWSGRSPGEGTGNPLQYSCLETPKLGGAQQATVHWVAKSQT